MRYPDGQEGGDVAGTPIARRSEGEGTRGNPVEHSRLAFTPIGQVRGAWWTALDVSRDVVGVTSNDSFPASDPPSWSALSVGPPRDHR